VYFGYAIQCLMSRDVDSWLFQSVTDILVNVQPIIRFVPINYFPRI